MANIGDTEEAFNKARNLLWAAPELLETAKNLLLYVNLIGIEDSDGIIARAKLNAAVAKAWRKQ